MTVVCVECSRYSFQGEKEMAKLGFGRCTASGHPGIFPSPQFERICDLFRRANEEDIESRLVFIEKVRTRFREAYARTTE